MQRNESDNKRALPPRFVLDGSLGDVAKFLRIMGFSAELRATSLMKQKIAVDRIVITRSEELGNYLAKQGKRTIVLPKRDAGEGIVQDLRVIVKETISNQMLSYMFCTPFCQKCNSPLEIKNVEEVRFSIPEKSLQQLNWVYYCSKCTKSYWLGSHWERIGTVLGQVLKEYNIIIPRPWQKTPPCQ